MRLCVDVVRLQALTGLPPSSRLCRLWSRKEEMQWAWDPDKRAVWDQVRLSHCRHEGLVTVRDEATMIIHNGVTNVDSRWGHQCSETTLAGESRFHISTPRGMNPVPSWREQRVDPLDQWDCVWMQWDCRLSTELTFFSARWHCQNYFLFLHIYQGISTYLTVRWFWSSNSIRLYSHGYKGSASELVV